MSVLSLGAKFIICDTCATNMSFKYVSGDTFTFLHLPACWDHM